MHTRSPDGRRSRSRSPPLRAPTPPTTPPIPPRQRRRRRRPRKTLDTVSVIGQRRDPPGAAHHARSTSRCCRRAPAARSSSTSLPGVSVQSNDAFGANEESQSITLRGFDKSRLGYTLDGIPLGDNSYGNYNGLSISRALIRREPGRRRTVAGHRLAGRGLHQQPRRHPPVLLAWTRPPSPAAARSSHRRRATTRTARGYLRADTGDLQRLLGLRVRRAPGRRTCGPPPHQAQTTQPVQRQGGVECRRPPLRRVRRHLARQPGQLRLPVQGACSPAAWAMTGTSTPRTGTAPSAAAYCAPAHLQQAARCQLQRRRQQHRRRLLPEPRAARRQPLRARCRPAPWASEASPEAAGLPPRQPWPGPLVGAGPGRPTRVPDRLLPISIRSHQLHHQPRPAGTAALYVDAGASTSWRPACGTSTTTTTSSRNFYYVSGPFLDDLYLQTARPPACSTRTSTIRTRQFYVQDRMRFLDHRLTVDVGIKSPRHPR